MERRRSRGRSELLPVAKLPPGEPWGALSAQMAGCQRCELSRDRQHVVLYRGAARPAVLLVGEAPGKDEDAQGLPFVGRAGRILDEAVLGAGLVEGEWGVTNVIMCRPPKNRFDRAAAASCRPWLAAKVASLRPQLIVTLGANALEAFLPDALPVSQAAGRLLAWEEMPLFAMLHPAATLHSRGFSERWKNDWKAFSLALPRWRRGWAERGEQTPILSPGSEDRGALRALPPRGFLPSPP